jgi:ABC-type microcin C transport system duplicated ATPase subunit YejF
VVVESGPAKDVIDHPQQAATQAFLARFHDKPSEHVASRVV